MKRLQRFNAGSFLSIICFVRLSDRSYRFEFVEGNFSVEVFICFNNSPVHQLLQLHVRQVSAHHHLQHREQFAIRDVPVVVDVVDLKCELQLFFLVGARRE